MKRESLALAVICLIFVVLSFPAQAQVSFLQPPLYSGGGNVFVADFNGDGKPDILTSANIMNLGNGDGTFTLGTVVSGSFVLAVADFNGDGKPDVLEQGTGTLLVLLGNGDGTFQAPISTASSSSLSVVAAVDLKGDGKADVVGVSGSSLVVYLSNGDGTFVAGVSYNMGVAAGTALLSFGDFNNDSKADVVVSVPGNPGAGFEVVFLGNGDGTLQAEKTFSSINDPQYAAVGDFNGDGNLDLAISGCNATTCSSASAGGVYILAGGGNGTVQAPVSACPGGGPIAAGDVNGDGKLDVVENSGVAQICLGNGDGTFSNNANYLTSFDSPPPVYGAAIADFNGDGKPDVAANGQVLLGNGNGTFQGILEGFIPGPADAVVVGDFEKTGYPDVAVLSYQPGNSNSESNIYILHNSNGGLSLRNTYTIQPPGYAIATADFNGDGKLDLMVVSTDPTTQEWGYSVLLGNGDGSFQPPTFYPQSVATFTQLYSIAVGDFNNDTKLDVAITSANSVALLLGNGDGTFALPSYVNDALPAATLTLFAGDFNGDGKLDIAAASDQQTAILLGNGDGTFQPAVLPSSLSGFVAQFIADLNNDDKPDLVGTFNTVALGNGDGTFTLLPTLGQYQTSAIADLNGDGKPDELVTYYGNSTHAQGTGVLLGNGDGTFGPLISVPANGLLPIYGGGVNSGIGLLADMNGDGRPDIIFAPSGGIAVMFNSTQAVPPQPDFQVFASGLSPTPVTAGNSSTSTITVSALNGFTGTVALSCSGLTTGVSCSFNPASIPGGSGASTLTVTTASSLAAGSYTVVISGVSGSLSHIAALTLTVESGTTADFQFSATATSPATVAPGSSATSTVTVAAVSGFNSAVALTCSSSSGITCSLSPTSVTPSGSTSPTSTLTINTATSLATGTYSVTLYGTSGSDVHSIAVTLTVQPTAPGFTLGAASGSSTSQTINAGQTASFSLAMAPTGGFTGTVNFTCAITPTATPAPTFIVPSSMQITGSGTQTVAVQVGTTAPVTTGFVPPVSFPTGPMPMVWTLTLLTSVWSLMRNRRRRRVFAAPVMVLALAFSIGCGGSSSSHTTPGTPSGTYTATVTATSGSVSQNMALTVVVQ